MTTAKCHAALIGAVQSAAQQIGCDALWAGEPKARPSGAFVQLWPLSSQIDSINRAHALAQIDINHPSGTPDVKIMADADIVLSVLGAHSAHDYEGQRIVIVKRSVGAIRDGDTHRKLALTIRYIAAT